MGLADSYYGMILDCDLTSFQDVNVSDPARLLEPRDSVDGGKLDNWHHQGPHDHPKGDLFDLFPSIGG